MDAYNLYECDLADPRTMQQVITLCAELQRDIRALTAQVAELTAMRDTLNAVFTIEAPERQLVECPACNGLRVTYDEYWFTRECAVCSGTGKVQP